MRETDLVKSCLEWLSYHGIYCWRNNTAGIYSKKSGGYFFHGMRGVGDIVGILPDGRFLSVECKVGTNKPTEHQTEFMKKIAENNGVAIWVSSLDELRVDLVGLGIIRENYSLSRGHSSSPTCQ
jgi:hypothetical protein